MDVQIGQTQRIEKKFFEAKIGQAYIVFFEILFFVIAIILPPLHVVGSWSFGVYSQFYWIILLPIIDIIILTLYKKHRVKLIMALSNITLIMFLLGSATFMVLGWTSFCCTDQGFETGSSTIPIIWLLAFVTYYLPRFFSLYHLRTIDAANAASKNVATRMQ